MPREKLIKKVGSIAIVRLKASPNFYVRFYREGRMHWQSVGSPDLRNATHQAEQLDDLSRRRRGLIPLREERQPLFLFDVVETDLESWDIREKDRRRYRAEALRFGTWLKAQEIAAEDFAVSDLDEMLLRRYVAHLKDEFGFAYDGIRHALIPIRRAARYAETLGVPNRIRNFRLKQPAPPEIPWVRLEVVLQFQAELQNKRPDLAGICALMGLAGLRELEAAFLRLCDYQPGSPYALVTVTESGAHKPKNRASYRTIPICKQASSYLETWLKQAQPAGNEDMIFVPEGGTAWTGDALSRRLSHYLRAFRLTIRPRDPRKSFSTHCENVLRVPPSDALDMYLGQVGGRSALRARHYTATMIETLARDIVQPLENSLSAADRKNVESGH
jgi:site-specific recombinase XerD